MECATSFSVTGTKMSSDTPSFVSTLQADRSERDKIKESKKEILFISSSEICSDIGYAASDR